MRLFLAINIPDDVKDLLNREIIRLKRELNQNMKWVIKKNWHITLQFLGEIEKRNIEFIKEKMKYIAERTEQQSLTFSRLAAFPCLEYPQVLYIGIENGSKELINLYRNLNNQLKDINSKQNSNSYTPHLTIARVKRNADKKIIGFSLQKFKDDFSNVKMLVNKISLMSSTLSQRGAVYKELYSLKLLEKFD